LSGDKHITQQTRLLFENFARRAAQQQAERR
jgi:hypothetical protein